MYIYTHMYIHVYNVMYMYKRIYIYIYSVMFVWVCITWGAVGGGCSGWG